MHNLKIFLNSILIFLFTFSIIIIDIKFINFFEEKGLFIELTQVFLIFCIIYIFFKLSIKIKEIKLATTLIAAFFTVVLIRESDGLFDKIFHGFWKVPALLITAMGLYYCFKNYKKGLESLAKVMNIPSFKFLIFSILFLLVYSRLFGMSELWKEVMSENYLYLVKSIVEESSELLAYVFILCSSLLVKKDLENKYIK